MIYHFLPSNYILTKTINTQDDRRLVFTITAAQLLICLVMILSAVFFFPFSDFVSFTQPRSGDALRLLLLIPSIFIYMAAHELIHGLFIRIYSKQTPKFGFSGLYMYAESAVFFDRRSFFSVMAAPSLIFFMILLVIGIIVPNNLFWFFYILQIINISSSTADFYTVFQAKKMPKNTFFRISRYKAEFYCEAEIIKTQ